MLICVHVEGHQRFLACLLTCLLACVLACVMVGQEGTIVTVPDAVVSFHRAPGYTTQNMSRAQSQSCLVKKSRADPTLHSNMNVWHARCQTMSGVQRQRRCCSASKIHPKGWVCQVWERHFRGCHSHRKKSRPETIFLP